MSDKKSPEEILEMITAVRVDLRRLWARMDENMNKLVSEIQRLMIEKNK